MTPLVKVSHYTLLLLLFQKKLFPRRESDVIISDLTQNIILVGNYNVGTISSGTILQIYNGAELGGATGAMAPLVFWSRSLRKSRKSRNQSLIVS